ncbi:MAG: tetratricopeptide repeat protein [Spirochaetota bacterium]
MATIIPFPGGRDAAQDAESRFPGLYLQDLGLSDDQIATLSDGRHEGLSALLEVAPRLEPSDREAAPVLAQTIGLLRSVQDREPARATANGNLPVVIVKELFAGPFADAEPEYVRVNREDDSMVLSRVRWLAQKAGLLAFRSGAFRLTKVATAALDSDNVDEIYRRLLEAHLRAPREIDHFDRIFVGGAIAETVPLLLFAARDATAEYLYEEDFADLLLAVRDDSYAGSDALDHAVQLRFFERFGEHFGLFEKGPDFEPPVELPDRTFMSRGRWRRTGLFDRAFRWHVDPPKLAVQRPQVAAARLMYPIHELPYPIDGTEDYRVRELCLRALERCPSEANAYVVLARLYAERPELALSLADAGISATAGTSPEVPDGVSPWCDHLYRDILRLHFVRAESLLRLGRTDDAFAEYEELLRIDPEDGIGAAHSYFAGLTEAGEHERAQHVLDRFADDESATTFWNATLAAFALGEKDLAATRAEAAMAANPHVPEFLLARRPPGAPDSYTPGDEDEAAIYAESFHDLWRTVRGAREWLRRRASGRR